MFAEIGERLEAGYTLPAGWYSDSAILALERERIFKHTWQYACVTAEVAEPGDYYATRAGHIPVVLVRDQDGNLNGFVNVCRHRGHVVMQGSGHRETLQCPYHAWTYGLDGRLTAFPGAEPGFEDVDKAAHGLIEVPVLEAHGLVFALAMPGDHLRLVGCNRPVDDGAQGGLRVPELDFFNGFCRHGLSPQI